MAKRGVWDVREVLVEQALADLQNANDIDIKEAEEKLGKLSWVHQEAKDACKRRVAELRGEEVPKKAAVGKPCVPEHVGDMVQRAWQFFQEEAREAQAVAMAVAMADVLSQQSLFRSSLCALFYTLTDLSCSGFGRLAAVG